MNSLPKTVNRQRRGCDLNPGPSAPESSTLTTRLPSHPYKVSRPAKSRLFSLKFSKIPKVWKKTTFYVFRVFYIFVIFLSQKTTSLSCFQVSLTKSAILSRDIDNITRSHGSVRVL